MNVDDLVTEETMATTAMVLTFSRNIQAQHKKGNQNSIS